MIDPRGLGELGADVIAHGDAVPHLKPAWGLIVCMVQQALRDCYRGARDEQLEAAYWLLTSAPDLIESAAGIESSYFSRCVEAVLPADVLESVSRLTVAEAERLAHDLPIQEELFE